MSDAEFSQTVIMFGLIILTFLAIVALLVK